MSTGIDNDTQKNTVTSGRLVNTYGDIILKTGFTATPNTLIEHSNELNLTNSEFRFLLSVLRFTIPYFKQTNTKKIATDIITDVQINMPGNLTAIRKSLVKKGYINIHKDYMNGKCFGTWYDLTQLFTKLEALLIEKEVAIKIKQEEKKDGQTLLNFDSLETKENIKQHKEETKKEVIKSVEKTKEVKEKATEEIKQENEQLNIFINLWTAEGYEWKSGYSKTVLQTLEKYKPNQKELKKVLDKFSRQTYPEYMKINFLADRLKREVTQRLLSEEKEKLNKEREKQEKENKAKEELKRQEEERAIFEREAKERGLTSDEYSLYCEAMAKRAVGFELTNKEKQILDKVRNCEVLI